MIRLTLQENEATYASFSVEGHSTLGKKGDNLLCAGVSALIQTIVLGLKEVLKLNLKLIKQDGFIHCDLPKPSSEKEKEAINLLMMTLIMAFNDLSRQYPDQMDIVWIN